MLTPHKIECSFAKLIADKKKKVKPPNNTDLIKFRTDVKENNARQIYQLPIDLLYYRKDNGRIASDVHHYEKNTGPLDETSSEGQNKLKEFLGNKDLKKREELENIIMQEGQRDPAIITCDGFLNKWK